MEALAEKAKLLRKSLEKSQATTEQIVAVLSTFDGRLSTIDAATRPIQEIWPACMRCHENVSKSLKKTEVIISQFDRIKEAELIIFKGPSDDLNGFLEAMDQLLKISRFFNSRKTYAASERALFQVNTLLTDAIKMAETEFNKMLTALSKPVDFMKLFDCLPCKPTTVSGKDESETESKEDMPTHKLPTLISPRYIPLLHNLAIRLVLVGHHVQCLHIYADARANVLQKTLNHMGVRKIGKEEFMKMQWDNVDHEIPKWVDQYRISVKLLFAGERKLCDQVFEGIEESFLDRCFVEVTSDSLATLLSFVDAVLQTRKTPEKLFKILDIYEVMLELEPEMKAMFASEENGESLGRMVNLRKRMITFITEILLGFQEEVLKDSSKPNSDGGVHPISSYVMNYLKYLLDYQEIVTQLLLEYNPGGQKEHLQFASLFLQILQSLHSNLETKSKHCKDPGLSHLFLMNNIHYMVTTVSRTEAAKNLLGKDWIQRQRRVVQVNATQYRRVSWAKVLESISSQGLLSSSGGSSNPIENPISTNASKDVIKERFKTFNTQYEEQYHKQCLWKVHETELRENLRVAVSELLLNAYRAFLHRFGPMVENIKNKCIKYSEEDIERMVGELFEGKTPG